MVVTKTIKTKRQKSNLSWVHNILEHKAEMEKILLEDVDPTLGFIMLPDTKCKCAFSNSSMPPAWCGTSSTTTASASQALPVATSTALALTSVPHNMVPDVIATSTKNDHVNTLHLLALVMRRDIKSIRDLRAHHLPLLHNIRTKIHAEMKRRFDLNPYELRLYFHYVPSYWHLHLHVTYAGYVDAPGAHSGRAHLLNDVIDNLCRDPTYYACASLSIMLPNTHALVDSFLLSRDVADDAPKN